MATHPDIASIRKIYKLQSLLEEDVDPNPFKQFEKWWQQAMESKIEEPNAMILATSTADGKPSCRTVLLKDFTEKGFVFFSNYGSRKAFQIEQNPFVSLLFFWKEMERQVRIEGSIRKISAEESNLYFDSRPRDSKIGAWSSPQSQVINNREFLQQNVEKYNAQFDTENIPRPPFWGGYIVIPSMVEYWQGRPGRLHDRLQYTSTKNEWEIKRLAP
ncbi:MAG: pyridoxamine 5'-phosphate oxidase [Ginsengibacter sp.]